MLIAASAPAQVKSESCCDKQEKTEKCGKDCKKHEKKENKEKKPLPEWVSHFKPYGFIRNYFTFDTRASAAGTEDFFYFMPLDRNISSEGVDLNEYPTFRFAALTTRLGLDVINYEYAGYKFGAKVEMDFYAGLSGSTGTAQLRLRQAYVTVDKGARSWKVGQAWHPMAIDLPDVFSLESGSPFGPFSRTPLVNFEYKLGKGFALAASAIWQMQYTSTGPEGNSANYIKYGCTPEFFLGAYYKGDKAAVKIGADVLSIKPRKDNGTVKVSDRLTTYSVFQYGQFKAGEFTIKEKLIYGTDMSHMQMIGGYGVSNINEDGSWNYSATQNLAAWASGKWSRKDCRWSPALFVGYCKNFGTGEQIIGNSWCKNYATTCGQIYRIQPEVVYTLGHFQVGLEYMFTGCQYGDVDPYLHGALNQHWVYNHRIQAMVKFNF